MVSIWATEYCHNLINSLVKLFDVNRHSGYRDIKNIINKNKSKDDLEILKIVCDYAQQHWKRSINVNRNENRAKELVSMISGKVDGYLDIGCGDGGVTQLVGNMLGLSKDNIHGIDIYPVDNKNITFHLATADGSILLPDNSIGAVTAVVSFHHIDKLDKTLSELQRIMKQDSCLVIREHDCDRSSQTAVFIDYIHAMLMLLSAGEFNIADMTWPDAKKYIISYMKSIKYNTKTNWDNMLAKYSFKRVNYTTYEMSNPQKLYFATYILHKA